MWVTEEMWDIGQYYWEMEVEYVTLLEHLEP